MLVGCIRRLLALQAINRVDKELKSDGERVGNKAEDSTLLFLLLVLYFHIQEDLAFDALCR